MNSTKKFANEIRIEVLKMLNNLGFGHYGGSMSVIETLAVLYNDIMKYDPKNPNWEERDYFVLSKGHAGPALYSTLALKGFFDKKELLSLNVNGTNLPSHPDRLKTKGVDVTTGSLGQGISIATGIAKGLKILNKSNKVFCIIGDGEAQEGQVWEAMQFIAHNNLNNMIVFIDYNKKQLDDELNVICEPFSFEEKAKAFGLSSITVKGNDIDSIRNACNMRTDKPLVIVLDSIKGQGVKFLETLKSNHHLRINNESKEKLEKELCELESEVF
ncbi:transketolase [Oceanivirga salmonicida]|uniref:transketolase n=1 Tax=Oceanivirga salmonicida TaxID=1769291 RepID=UPI001E366241|nr:transketolase [Oceanivirga salmonicida]